VHTCTSLQPVITFKYTAVITTLAPRRYIKASSSKRSTCYQIISSKCIRSVVTFMLVNEDCVKLLSSFCLCLSHSLSLSLFPNFSILRSPCGSTLSVARASNRQLHYSMQLPLLRRALPFPSCTPSLPTCMACTQSVVLSLVDAAGCSLGYINVSSVTRIRRLPVVAGGACVLLA